MLFINVMQNQILKNNQIMETCIILMIIAPMYRCVFCIFKTRIFQLYFLGRQFGNIMLEDWNIYIVLLFTKDDHLLRSLKGILLASL